VTIRDCRSALAGANAGAVQAQRQLRPARLSRQQCRVSGLLTGAPAMLRESRGRSPRGRALRAPDDVHDQKQPQVSHDKRVHHQCIHHGRLALEEGIQDGPRVMARCDRTQLATHDVTPMRARTGLDPSHAQAYSTLYLRVNRKLELSNSEAGRHVGPRSGENPALRHPNRCKGDKHTCP